MSIYSYIMQKIIGKVTTPFSKFLAIYIITQITYESILTRKISDKNS